MTIFKVVLAVVVIVCFWSMLGGILKAVTQATPDWVVMVLASLGGTSSAFLLIAWLLGEATSRRVE